MRRLAHRLLRKAEKDANRFKILPGAEWGYVLWRQSDHYAWKWFRLAHVSDRTQLEELACEKLARLAE